MPTMKEIQAIGRRIGREFNASRVILFGSHAHGQAGPDSDVDILVILPFRGRKSAKSLEILNRLDLSIPIDLLARRPADVKRRYAQCDPIMRDAIDRGKVLYERHR